jgi:hypothetical protein
MEVELVALESATIEVEWLKELLMDLPMVTKLVLTILLHCDNQSMITIVGNAKFSRHVKWWIKLVRHLRNTGEIVVEYINTTQNQIDPFTKGLAHAVVDETSMEMGLKPTWCYHIVVTHSMWSEIPWIRFWEEQDVMYNWRVQSFTRFPL